MSKKDWHHIHTYVDIETGECLIWQLENKNYSIIRTTKKYGNLNKPVSIIRHTHECRRKPKQLTINY